MFRQTLHAVSVGVWLGAIAGVATSLSDFGAHWLFMESAGDRTLLLLRLLSLQPAAGAALGALGGLVYGCAAGPIDRLATQRAQTDTSRVRIRRGLLSLCFTLALLPALLVVTHLLFKGGHMSRLPARAALHFVAGVFLTCTGFCSLYAVHALVTVVRRTPPAAARRVFLGLLALSFGIAKLNQRVLPNLYDYLHGVLSASVLGIYALCTTLLLARAWDGGRIPRDLPRFGAALAVLLGLLFHLSLGTLDQNQNVRVALLSANVPHSRSLMLGIAPLLPTVDRKSADLARLRATAARVRRATGQEALGLPTLPGAHVLLITVDALRADHLGCYGYGRHITSELDAIARDAVVFDHAYAQAPHSSYSLCSLMTSEYLHETLELGQPAPMNTLPRVVTQAGYHTAAFYTQGIFHTAGEKLSVYEHDAFGFALHEHQDRPAEELTDRAIEEVDRTLSRGEPSSLFWVHYFDVHEPYDATTLGNSDLDRYDSEILATDRAIGRLVSETKRRLHKPVVVVVTADHGEEFHEHGGVYHGSSLYEEQVRVPLIIAATGLAPKHVAAPVESIDIAPTLLGLLDVDKPSSMRGVDLRALALGKARDRGPVFSAVIHKKMVVSWPYKLIADLRFGLFELYDLSVDPRERDNRADHDPHRLESLRGEVYAFIDSLAPVATIDARPQVLALEWGRLGDRRAVAPLSELALDEHAATEDRAEAARLLGKLADASACDTLFAATKTKNPWVSAEAAIAMGRLFDGRAAPLLRKLVVAEDPGVRSRAAVSLGRLRDVAAVPSLIDALWIAPSGYEREEAVRWLGHLRDTRALDPLISLLPEAHTRHLVVVAMGELGDSRAFAPLVEVLGWDRNTNVRDGVMRGLGVLGDPRGIDVIVPRLSDEPGLRNSGESLVRLHAIDRHRIGGTDVTRAYAGVAGFGTCFAGPIRHDWDYLHRTTCTTRSPQVSLRLSVPTRVSDAAYGCVAVLSIKRIDSALPAELRVSIGGKSLAPVRVHGAWAEYRWSLEPGTLARGSVQAELHSASPEALFEVDHLLLVPRTAPEPPVAHGG